MELWEDTRDTPRKVHSYIQQSWEEGREAKPWQWERNFLTQVGLGGEILARDYFNAIAVTRQPYVPVAILL